MILGRGNARSSDEIIAEYTLFLRDVCPRQNVEVAKRMVSIPRIMVRKIGKPVTDWKEEEIVALYRSYQLNTQRYFNAFIAFLTFRGYLQPTLELLGQLPSSLVRQHRQALAPWRKRLEQTQQTLHYRSGSTGSELRLLIWLLAVAGKSLDELTRADFDRFQAEYRAWYQASGRRGGSDYDARLPRLERYLIHWGVIPQSQIIFRHQEYFARLHHENIRAAMTIYLQWCDAKYKPSTIHSRRAALLNFFGWLQTNYPERSRLNQVERTIALEYAQYHRGKIEEGTYALQYAHDQNRVLRLFFDFAIDERLDSSPNRNPFTGNELPRRSDPIPRYLSDREVNTILEHCNSVAASLKERVIVITLLHTGIRASELAALKVTDIVRIQGMWKLHIHEGKGLKDRMIPLTALCLELLERWQKEGWERVNDFLFTRHGRPWRGGTNVGVVVRELGLKLGLSGVTPHRFRHTFAVALLNYGMRESALQKLMGHATLGMTLEYGRILDQTVEQEFDAAVEQMQRGALRWIPDFFGLDDFTLFSESDAVNWIRLPHGYCRRHPKLHCESDVKCLLCDRFCATISDLPRFEEMHTRYLQLGMEMKAEVVASQIRRLEEVGCDRKQSDVVPEVCPMLLPA